MVDNRTEPNLRPYQLSLPHTCNTSAAVVRTHAQHTAAIPPTVHKQPTASASRTLQSMEPNRKWFIAPVRGKSHYSKPPPSSTHSILINQAMAQNHPGLSSDLLANGKGGGLHPSDSRSSVSQFRDMEYRCRHICKYIYVCI